MKRIATLFSILLLVAGNVLAVPARQVRKTVRTTDGKTVEVTLRGDENFSFYETDDGLRLRQQPDGLFAPFTIAEQQQSMERARKVRQREDDRRLSIRHRASALKGKFTGLVILAEFSDVRFSTGNNAIFTDFFNKPNYNGFGMTGSVHDYFLDQSYGQFDVSFDVIGPVTLSKPMAAYGAHVINDKGEDVDKDSDRLGFAYDAIIAASSLTDFSKYDWDHDGEVDQVFIVYAGYSEAAGGPENSIWPHESSIRAYGLKLNGVSISTYGCSSELQGSSGKEIAGIGTACHEFSHCLGLMDHYDTQYNGNYGMGKWDIMSSGDAISNGRNPIGYTAYERWVSGWLEPKEISSYTEVANMPALETTPEAYIIYNDANRNEFYMLENRNVDKWGVSLINTKGLLVTHVDYDPYAWRSNTINCVKGRERMTVIPADNIRGDANLTSDVYPSRGNNSLTDTSTPAAVVYNANVDGSFLMGKPIENITVNLDGQVSFSVMKGIVLAPENFDYTQTDGTSLHLSWDEIAGAKGYELSWIEIPAQSDNPEDAVMFYEDFATSCYASKVNTMSNIANKLDANLTTKGWTGSYLYKGPKGLQIGSSSKTGNLRTPDIKAPYSGIMTAGVALCPAVSGTKVDVPIEVYIDGTYLGKYSLTCTQENGFLLSVPETTGTIAFNIVPNKAVSILEFELFDGEFNYDDFDAPAVSYAGNDAEAQQIFIPSPALINKPHKASPIESTLKSDTNSLDIKGLKATSTYVCQLRADMGDGFYSRWTNKVEIKLNDDPDAIESLPFIAPCNGTLYDLSGRKVVAPATHGIYIHGGKKILK